MRALAILGSKGGVGKTSVAVNLAAALARKSGPVALVDCDAAAGATSWLAPTAQPTLDRDLATGRPMRLTEIPAVPGLLLAAAGPDLADLDEDFARIEDFAESLAVPKGVRAAVFDTAPSIGALMAAALRVADSALLVVDCHSLGLANVGQLLDLLEKMGRVNRRLRIVGILPNRRDRTRDSREAEETLRKRFAGVLKPIRAAACVAAAAGRGCSVWSMPDHPVRDDFEALLRAVTATKGGKR